MEKQNDGLPYQCSECNMSFEGESDMIVHMRCHSGEKSYSCNQCNKSFKDKPTLIGHVKRHTREKPYSCNLCNKSFKSRYYLKIHIRNHTGERPYNCEQCDMSFKFNSSLKFHMRVHTGENTNSCSVCHKSFLYKNELTKHMRKHTGERPYNCNQCDRTFKHKGNLDRHLISHTIPVYKNSNIIRHENNAKLKGFACFVCKARFHDLSTCRTHMKSHKNIPMLEKGRSLSLKDSRMRAIKNSLNPNSSLNGITLPIDQTSIKMELDEGGDIKNELEDMKKELEDVLANPLQKMNQSSEHNFQRNEILAGKEQVIDNIEHLLMKDKIKQEKLDCVGSEVEEDEIIKTAISVKQEIEDDEISSYNDTFL